MEPITFHPLYMERVWGGRELERVYGRALPNPVLPYGESWEIVDREETQSVVCDGRFAGKTLNELWVQHREEVFGDGFPDSERFPILIKILDARDDLSIQVHPPASLAAGLNGEPKTEMWFIADCNPGAKLYAGLKSGVTRGDFENAIAHGTVADCVHAITPKPGDSIFIESGRLHAIGAGFLIHEIQQNSDTTYRVFDWNRVGLDHKPRELHVAESLASIDFGDFEPAMDHPNGENLACCEYFKTDLKKISVGESIRNPHPSKFSILSIVDGALKSASGQTYSKGSLVLLPRGSSPLGAIENSTVLQISLPSPSDAASVN
ncbi:MAG: mannose-6-phosphate isomerase [Akkermansiaceae bacterium]|nr:mannose-6-phosphate isomerase [Akkermansiaceae bacterium]